MTRWARIAAAAILALAAAGCALPVSIPLGPIAGLTGGAASDDDEIVTGSVGPAVEDGGISERVGQGAWPSLRAAVARAVERGEDGQTFPWKSEREELAGTVTPVTAYFGETGAVCRRLAITAARTSDLSDVFHAEACRLESGRWSVGPGTGEA